jgi:hypothetical protein
LPPRDRQSRNADLESFYQSEEGAHSGREAFFDHAPLSEIVRIGRQGQLRFEGDLDIDVAHDGGKRMDVVVLRYAIDYEDDGKPQTLSFLVSVGRRYDAERREAGWNVRDVTAGESPDL